MIKNQTLVFPILSAINKPDAWSFLFFIIHTALVAGAISIFSFRVESIVIYIPCTFMNRISMLLSKD